MKVLLVNLDRAPDRLRHFTAEAATAGLPFERVAAVDGSRLSPAEIAAQVPGPGRFYRLGSGEIACFMSHRACWRRIAEGSEPFAIIMEDDVHLGAEAATILSSGAWIPPDADIVKLETVRHNVMLGPPLAGPAGRTLRRLRSTHGGTAGYVVSRTCAARLYAATARFADPLDQYMFNPASPAFDGLVTYQLVPALCIQEASRADRRADPRLASALRAERSGNRGRRLRRLLQAPARLLRKLRRGSAEAEPVFVDFA